MAFPTLQIVIRPGILELGWGHPDPALLPVDAIRAASAASLDRYGSDALQYGYARGAGPLLEWLAARIGRLEGRVPSPEEILLTGGNSWALDALLTLSVSPGDPVLVEAPTYHLALTTLRDHHVDLVPIPSDQEGLLVDQIPPVLDSLQRDGRRVRLLYSVPTFNNPTGVSISDTRRHALVGLAEREGFLIIEDDVYRDLTYTDHTPPSLWSLAAPDVVARMGSFSKSVAPALRLGWLTSGKAWIEKVAMGGVLDSGGGISPLTALAVAELCRSGGFDEQIAQLCVSYAERSAALVSALRDSLPSGCNVITPQGGFFVWVTLPEAVNSEALLPYAESQGVSYVPGTRFYASDGGSHALRLAFSLYSPADLTEAAHRLSKAIIQFIEKD